MTQKGFFSVFEALADPLFSILMIVLPNITFKESVVDAVSACQTDRHVQIHMVVQLISLYTGHRLTYTIDTVLIYISLSIRLYSIARDFRSLPYRSNFKLSTVWTLTAGHTYKNLLTHFLLTFCAFGCFLSFSLSQSLKYWMYYWTLLLKLVF